MMANRGALGKILSTLSRKPPRPGNIVPVSSLLELLLKTLTVRSPNTEYKPIHKEDKIIGILSKLMISAIMNAVKLIANKPKNKPSQVFFGLITIASFDFPNLFPPK